MDIKTLRQLTEIKTDRSRQIDIQTSHIDIWTPRHPQIHPHIKTEIKKDIHTYRNPDIGNPDIHIQKSIHTDIQISRHTDIQIDRPRSRKTYDRHLDRQTDIQTPIKKDMYQDIPISAQTNIKRYGETSSHPHFQTCQDIQMPTHTDRQTDR